MRTRETGLTLLGLLLMMVVLIVTILLAAKIVPAYYENRRIQAIMTALSDQARNQDATDGELRKAFDRRAQVEDIRSVASTDLEIDKTDHGKIVHVAYSAKVPIIEHVTLVIDFTASSAGQP